MRKILLFLALSLVADPAISSVSTNPAERDYICSGKGYLVDGREIKIQLDTSELDMHTYDAEVGIHHYETFETVDYVATSVSIIGSNGSAFIEFTKNKELVGTGTATCKVE